MTPSVSIILPTYNRARFLPDAIQSIRDQQFTDWELIIVDDGSTDETAELIPRLPGNIAQPVKFIRQENQGAYAARNTGLDHAQGKYIAFYDSDDIWLPHHLQNCVQALATNAQVDWVYGACQIVDQATGEVITTNTFYVDDAPRPFVKLVNHKIGDLHIVDDRQQVECMIRHGFFCGLQNSVIRAAAFANRRFQVAHRHEGEDRIFALSAAANGVRFGYFDSVHVIYRIHLGNSSGSSSASDPRHTREILAALVGARRELLKSLPLTRRERAALRRRISGELFWGIGYATQWQHGHRMQAIRSYASAIRTYPWVAGYWKTLFACLLRATLGIGAHQKSACQRVTSA